MDKIGKAETAAPAPGQEQSRNGLTFSLSGFVLCGHRYNYFRHASLKIKPCTVMLIEMDKLGKAETTAPAPGQEHSRNGLTFSLSGIVLCGHRYNYF